MIPRIDPLAALGGQKPGGGLLALDLSGTVGWCYGHPGALLPLFGVWYLPPGPRLGPKYAAFENELIMCLESLRPASCVMEAPLPAMAQGSDLVARQQLGLAAYTEGECYRARVPVTEQAASTVRALVLGSGRFAAGTVKEVAVAWCRARGWMVPDHNAADALILWTYATTPAAERALWRQESKRKPAKRVRRKVV